MIWQSLIMAIRHMGRNAMRTSLTTLGILIGVAAVIAMVSLGRGAAQRVSGDLEGLGHNLLFVVPGTEHRGGPAMGGGRPFVAEDGRAIGRQVAGVAAVAPVASRGIIAVSNGERWRTVVTGSDEAYLPVLNWKISRGRGLSPAELLSGAAVCILGDRVERELFGGQSGVGAVVRMGNVAYRVVGTLAAKGQSTFGQDQDNFVLIPLRTYQRRVSGDDYVSILFLSAAAGAASGRIKADVEALMLHRRHIHPGEEADFFVRDMKEVQAMVGSITSVLTALLAAIAAVSLLVGGIGIMNIMLVAVTERTREIGIRLAIGARARDVLAQFLVEAVVLSAFGGVGGIALGVTASYVAADKLGLPLAVDAQVILLAFGFSSLVGVVFGFFPARKAARLQPIEALRYE